LLHSTENIRRANVEILWEHILHVCDFIGRIVELAKKMSNTFECTNPFPKNETYSTSGLFNQVCFYSYIILYFNSFRKRK
jgi:hypothetical protein